MPNIELYGFSDPKRGWQLYQVKDAIRAAVASRDATSDTVITTIESSVERCGDGSPEPFIRIVSTNELECLAIHRALVTELKKTDNGLIDIEVQVIRHFFGR